MYYVLSIFLKCDSKKNSNFIKCNLIPRIFFIYWYTENNITLIRSGKVFERNEKQLKLITNRLWNFICYEFSWYEKKFACYEMSVPLCHRKSHLVTASYTPPDTLPKATITSGVATVIQISYIGAIDSLPPPLWIRNQPCTNEIKFW